jgi:hypothetical protein
MYWLFLFIAVVLFTVLKQWGIGMNDFFVSSMQKLRDQPKYS